jgi:hypothetical protein
MEWGGRWKPLQYVVARSFSPVSTFFVGQSWAEEVKLWTVNDVPDDITLTYDVYLVPWSHVGDVSADMVVTSGKRSVSGGSSAMLDVIDVASVLMTAGSSCTRTTCFLTVRSSSSLGEASIIPDAVFYLDLVKNIPLAPFPKFSTSNAKRLSDRVIQFDFSVDVTSPFVFLELVGANEMYSNARMTGVNNRNAGWFSSNNFLALGGKSYTLQYEAHEAIEGSVDDFMALLQSRSLQNVKTTC